MAKERWNFDLDLDWTPRRVDRAGLAMFNRFNEALPNVLNVLDMLLCTEALRLVPCRESTFSLSSIIGIGPRSSKAEVIVESGFGFGGFRAVIDTKQGEKPTLLLLRYRPEDLTLFRKGLQGTVGTFFLVEMSPSGCWLRYSVYLRLRALRLERASSLSSSMMPTDLLGVMLAEEAFW